MEELSVQPSTVLITDPKVLAIPIVENHEPLVDLIEQTEIQYGPSPEVPNNTNYTKMRKTVYEKLKQAQALLPEGLRFCLYEAYRSLTLQKMLFDERFEKVQAVHPGWTQEQIFVETTRLVSPVTHCDGSSNIPPHNTGAAIDVYLLDASGAAVDMGIHPKDWMEDTDGSLSVTDSYKISPIARHYRQVMGRALSAAGFVNYPTEFWHWSYGDRYWAFQLKKARAVYDSVG